MRFSSVILPLSLGAVAAAYPPGYITPTLASSVASSTASARSSVASVTASAGSAIASASLASSLAADVTKAAGYVASSASSVSSVAADVTQYAGLAISSASSLTQLASSAVASAEVLSSSASSVISYASKVSSSASAASSSAVSKPRPAEELTGDKFMCEDVVLKVVGYCCKNLMYFSNGINVMLAPQECKDAPLSKEKGLKRPIYVCPSDRVFGRCCPHDQSIGGCNTERAIAGLEEFMDQDLDYSTFFPSYLSQSASDNEKEYPH